MVQPVKESPLLNQSQYVMANQHPPASNEPAQIFAGLIKGGKPHQLIQAQGNHLVTSHPLYPSYLSQPRLHLTPRRFQSTIIQWISWSEKTLDSYKYK